MPFRPSACTAAAVSGATWRLRYTKSRRAVGQPLVAARISDSASSAASLRRSRSAERRRRRESPRSISPASTPRAPRRCGRGSRPRVAGNLDARASSARRPSPAGSRCSSPAGRARAPASTREAGGERDQHEAGAPHRQAHQALRRGAHRAGISPDEAHAPRIGRAHAERARGDLLDPRVQAPGARLELQPAVLDVELARARLLALELREQLAAPCAAK